MCCFHQGLGLMVSDDDTAFHGEFSDDWTVNGKVESISVCFYLCALTVCLSRCLAIFVHKVILKKISYTFITPPPFLLLQGVLSLANGDCLEGLFSGEWTGGLKVTGTYTKPAVDEPESKESNSLL